MYVATNPKMLTAWPLMAQAVSPGVHCTPNKNKNVKNTMNKKSGMNILGREGVEIQMSKT